MITVLAPGAYTLVQDGGRGGHEHLGVPTSGAFDAPLLALANTLAGNASTAPGFEVALAGPTLRFDAPAQVALAGSFDAATVNGCPVPAWHTLDIPAGATLSVGPLARSLRGYVAVRGGLPVGKVLGSASSCTLSGLGPARLSVGDTFDQPALDGRVYLASAPAAPISAVVRVLPGPHATLFTPAALAALTSTLWQVSPESSRVGVRLNGPAVDAPGVSLPSLGMVTGAVQVPPSGTPIVLGPDHGATGGYPVPFVVASADMSVLAQVSAGMAVRLQPVTSAPAQPRTSVWDLAALSA